VAGYHTNERVGFKPGKLYVTNKVMGENQAYLLTLIRVSLVVTGNKQPYLINISLCEEIERYGGIRQILWVFRKM